MQSIMRWATCGRKAFKSFDKDKPRVIPGLAVEKRRAEDSNEESGNLALADPDAAQRRAKVYAELRVAATEAKFPNRRLESEMSQNCHHGKPYRKGAGSTEIRSSVPGPDPSESRREC